MSKLALVFPGQGSQYVGMGKTYNERYSVVKEIFEEANDILGFDLQKMCFEGSIEDLTKTENTQPAILTVSVAMFKIFMEDMGIEPMYSAGHSLGEISALTCAGVIQFRDALKIVRQRGKFMQEASALGMGAMAAISGVHKNVIQEECQRVSDDGHVVVISNFNSPDQIVVSGHREAVEKLGETLLGKGGRIIPLKVSAPFHSPLMASAAVKLEEELKKYTYSKFKWPVLSNVSAKAYLNEGEVVEKLRTQMVQPVEWQKSMEYLQQQGVTVAVEIGPQTVLKNLMKKNAPSITAYSFDKEQDVQAVLERFNKEQGKSEKAKSSLRKFITRSLAIAVCTRNQNWDNDEYQKGVVEPYRKIQKLQEQLEQNGMEPTHDQMQEALDMLCSVFRTKKVEKREQEERFNQLFNETGTRTLFPDFL